MIGDPQQSAETGDAYVRAMRLLRDYFEYGDHPWSCRGERPSMKGCTCGLEELEELVDQEIESWREGCEHDIEVDAAEYRWCRICGWTDWDGGTRRVEQVARQSDGTNETTTTNG